MMERHLRSAEEWRMWLDTLARHPERGPELDARASLLHERAGAHPEGLASALRAAEHVEEALDSLPEVPAASPMSWGRLALVLFALAGGWGAARLSLPEPPAYRAAATPADGGTVRLEQDGRALAEVVVGRGVRPRVEMGGGALVLRLEQVPGFEAVAWWTDGAGRRIGEPTGLAGAAVLSVPPEARTLVVAVAPAGSDVQELSEVVGDARRSVEPLGDVRIVAFDVAAP